MIRYLHITAVLVGLLLVCPVPALGQAEKAKQAYEQGNYEEALKRFREAQLQKPDLPELNYNLGNVYYRQNQYEEALDQYQRSLKGTATGPKTAGDSLQSLAYYNEGNAFYRAGLLQEAQLAYQKALQVNPHDWDAKYNLEFVQKQLQKQQNQSPQQGDQDQKEQNQDQQQTQQDQSQGQNSAPEQPSQQPNPSPSQADEQNRSEQGAESEAPKLSKEEASRLLNALLGDEKEVLKQRLRKRKAKAVSPEKDW